MKKIYLLVVAVLLTVSFANAQSVMVVGDDNNGTEFEPVFDALITGGFTADTINLADTTQSISYSDISNYDMVIWLTGDDRVALNLWDTTSTPGTVKFNAALQQYYDNKDGAIWIDGLAFLKPLAIITDGSANDNDTIIKILPINYTAGSFVHDVLGIATWNFESKSMGDAGVSEADRASTNTITTLDPIEWTWAALWRAAGWTPVSSATDLYVMGPGSYQGVDYTMFHQYVNNGVVMFVSSIRIGKLGDGASNTFNQSKVDQLVKEIVNHSTVGINNIENTNISVYPNPATDIINISGITNAQVNITDITGKTVISENINNNAQINVSNLASGIYNINIITNEGNFAQKIVIK